MSIENTEVKTVKKEDTELKETQPKKKIRKIIAIILCVLFATVLIIYVGISIYFQSHFLPNTTINGMDCSNCDAEDVVNMLSGQIQEYTLEVTGRVDANGVIGTLGEIRAEDIQLKTVDTISAVESILKNQNAMLWVNVFAGSTYHHSLVQSVDFDRDLLNQLVQEWEVFQQMNEPQDAYISEYSEEKKGYEVIPEVVGNKLAMQDLIDSLEGIILAQGRILNLEEQEIYAKPDVTADDKVLNEKVNEVNRWLSTKVTYDWNGMEVLVDAEKIHEWTSFEDGEPKLDEEAVADFVADMARKRDTYGKKRNFMTTLGIEKELPSGAYGWKTDKEGETEALLDLIYRGSTTEKEPLYISKGRQKGMNDIGSSYVEADLTRQHLYLYYKGNLVLETDFVSGIMSDPGCVTPYGVFGLTYKTTNAVLRGENYETPVFYWMPFHGNFGMHDATWRTEFGGDIYLTNGSHGCLNLPLDKAQEIYGYVSTGFPIICYY